MATDVLNTVIPIILILAAAIWLWSKLGEPAKQFWAWLMTFKNSSKDRFKQSVGGIKELTYS